MKTGTVKIGAEKRTERGRGQSGKAASQGKSRGRSGDERGSEGKEIEVQLNYDHEHFQLELCLQAQMSQLFRKQNENYVV